jgi:hypothetical protein
MDFYLTWLPLLGGFILWTPSNDGLGGLPACRPESLVGVEFPTLLVFGMFLAAVGAFLAGLAGCLGWGSNNRHSRCLCRGKELLKHGHHVFHLLHVLCLKYICNLNDYHGLILGAREFFLRCLVRDAFSGSGGRPVPFDHLGIFVLNVYTEIGECLVGRKFGMPFPHCSVELTQGLVSRNCIREAQLRLLWNAMSFQLTLIFVCSCKHCYR